jgi:hypothetical protein
MESWFFKDIIGSKSERKMLLGDAIYEKVKEAILDNYERIEIFTLLSKSDSESPISGITFSLDNKQFHLFLENYLKVCEEMEEYEGEFKNGLRDGLGEHRFANGDRYNP